MHSGENSRPVIHKSSLIEETPDTIIFHILIGEIYICIYLYTYIQFENLLFKFS